jgi:Flp pilus assembly protein TadB
MLSRRHLFVLSKRAIRRPYSTSLPLLGIGKTSVANPDQCIQDEIWIREQASYLQDENKRNRVQEMVEKSIKEHRKMTQAEIRATYNLLEKDYPKPVQYKSVSEMGPAPLPGSTMFIKAAAVVVAVFLTLWWVNVLHWETALYAAFVMCAWCVGGQIVARSYNRRPF